MSTAPAITRPPHKMLSHVRRFVAALSVAMLTLLGSVALASPAHAAAFAVSGIVTDSATGDPIEWAKVYLVDGTGARTGPYETESDGYYELAVPSDGMYAIYIDADLTAQYASEYHPNTPFRERAELYTLSNSAAISLDLNLEEGGTIAGGITYEGASHVIRVKFFAYDVVDSTWKDIRTRVASPTEYLAQSFAPGDYKVQFVDFDAGVRYTTEYYDDARTLDTADLVTVAAGVGTTGIDAHLTFDGPAPVVSRLAGSNRFLTSVRIAQEYDSADAVFVANGLGFPDALSAAPAAAFEDAPLLLTQQNSLPAAVKAEIQRLDPSVIYVIGGTGVVSQSVENELATIVEVVRLAGGSRYSTSAAVLNEFWSDGSDPDVFLADGRNYPDALAAASAAGWWSDPVVLVNGALPALPADLKATLEAKDAYNIWLTGGSSVVSDGILASAETISSVNDVERFWGSNRYATSLDVNQNFFHPIVDTVYLAVGTGYADALAGAALAGTTDGALYLVPGNCVPSTVLDDIARLKADHVVLLGGTGVLSAAVEALTPCS